MVVASVIGTDTKGEQEIDREFGRDYNLSPISRLELRIEVKWFYYGASRLSNEVRQNI